MNKISTYFSWRWKCEGGYREFFTLAFPLILSTSSWSIEHFIDRMFLTWYSPETVAAAMPSGMLNFTVMSLFIGTAGYVDTFVAQYYGAKQEKNIGPVVWQGVYISLLGSLLLLLTIPFPETCSRFSATATRSGASRRPTTTSFHTALSRP